MKLHRFNVMNIMQQGHRIQQCKGVGADTGCVKNHIHLYETGNCYGHHMNSYDELQKHTN